MIYYLKGNLINIKAELLINAANGQGWMGGLLGRFIHLKGVAEAIHYADHSIERLAKKEAKLNKVRCGDVFFTHSGKLKFSKGILHAVTMEKPGQLSSISIVEKCIDGILTYCEVNNIKTATIPLLGTGTGKVNLEAVLKLYEEKLTFAKTTFYIVTL